MDVALYNTRIIGPAHVENHADLACRTALAYRGVSHITIPVDMHKAEVDPKKMSKRNVPHHTSDVCARGSEAGTDALCFRKSCDDGMRSFLRNRRGGILSAPSGTLASDTSR